jgi:hypothetical protein
MYRKWLKNSLFYHWPKQGSFITQTACMCCDITLQLPHSGHDRRDMLLMVKKVRNYAVRHYWWNACCGGTQAPQEWYDMFLHSTACREMAIKPLNAFQCNIYIFQCCLPYCQILPCDNEDPFDFPFTDLWSGLKCSRYKEVLIEWLDNIISCMECIWYNPFRVKENSLSMCASSHFFWFNLLLFHFLTGRSPFSVKLVTLVDATAVYTSWIMPPLPPPHLFQINFFILNYYYNVKHYSNTKYIDSQVKIIQTTSVLNLQLGSNNTKLATYLSVPICRNANKRKILTDSASSSKENLSSNIINGPRV